MRLRNQGTVGDRPPARRGRRRRQLDAQRLGRGLRLLLSQQQGGDLQGRFLVQGLVARAAFGRVDAGGAAVLAGAGRGELPGAAQQVLQDLVGPGRQAHAAGVAVIDEDGRPAHLGMRRVGDAADVVAVRQGKEREHADQDVLQGVDAPHEVAARRRKPRFSPRPGFPATCPRFRRSGAAVPKRPGPAVPGPAAAAFHRLNRCSVTLSRPDVGREAGHLPGLPAPPGFPSLCPSGCG